MSTAIAMRDAKARRRAGRPRHVAIATTMTPREQILDAAGRLFTTRGFAATSTREIAEKVGVRQASLYYHFAGKDEILGALLQRTLRPTLDQVDRILALTSEDTRATALYLLALVDIDTLASAPHNIGLLGRIPEVRSSPAAHTYDSGRSDLLEAYRQLAGDAVAEGPAQTTDNAHLGDLVLQLVESVIGLRAGDRSVSDGMAHTIATSCLRICGVSAGDLKSARSAAQERFDLFRAEQASG